MAEEDTQESNHENLKKNLIGPKVRIARERFQGGITQDQLSGRLAALYVPIDRSAITKIELGMRRVTDFEVVALANVLRVDVRWLLGLQKTGGPEIPGKEANDV